MCKHDWIKFEIERSAAGRTAKFFGEKCSICGDVAWTAESEHAYREWIKGLVKSEAFKIQNICLSKHSVEAIAKVHSEILVYSDSAIIKGCIGVYLSVMMQSESMSKVALDALLVTDQSPGKRSFNIKVSPALYFKLESIGKLSGQSVKEVVEDMANMVLSKVPAFYEALENQIAVVA